ncbi:hypothetical protein ANO14919_006200 [Xylariales sp. No.14919]|nr:hypothetical protein ANO14919_006200 [Xylariales sp. No.14919]
MDGLLHSSWATTVTALYYPSLLRMVLHGRATPVFLIHQGLDITNKHDISQTRIFPGQHDPHQDNGSEGSYSYHEVVRSKMH